ncbi:prepilin-type N-terminal cleavage/methylation domain-containing protein [Clostridium perfringens]|uniref:prepilin-type N-terminal cleavage/methylation domain-containing protein n=1 Tax=Clostridium perfringens TaxID=1502 RepID=UPI00374A080E
MNTKKQNKKKKGFTLIELIIVIAIIAILAAIAIPNFLGIQRKSKIKADIASAKTIYDATSAAIAEGKINPDKISTKNEENTLNEENTFELVPNPTNTPTGVLAEIEKNLQVIPTGKYTDGNFKVTIKPAPNGVKPEISVSIGNTEVYPDGKDEYSINNIDGKSTEKSDKKTITPPSGS